MINKIFLVLNFNIIIICKKKGAFPLPFLFISNVIDYLITALASAIAISNPSGFLPPAVA